MIAFISGRGRSAITGQPPSLESSNAELAGDFYVQCESANATAEAFVFDDVVGTDIPCNGCRYNVRGVKCDGVCPECGKPIRETLPRRGQVYAYRLRVANPDRIALFRTLSRYRWYLVAVLIGWAIAWAADEAFLGAVGAIAGAASMVNCGIGLLLSMRGGLVEEQWLLLGAESIVHLTSRSRTEVARNTIVSSTQSRDYLEIRGRPSIHLCNPAAWRVVSHHLRAWGIGIGQQRKWDLSDSISVSWPACLFMMPPSLELNALGAMWWFAAYASPAWIVARGERFPRRGKWIRVAALLLVSIVVPGAILTFMRRLL